MPTAMQRAKETRSKNVDNSGNDQKGTSQHKQMSTRLSEATPDEEEHDIPAVLAPLFPGARKSSSGTDGSTASTQPSEHSVTAQTVEASPAQHNIAQHAKPPGSRHPGAAFGGAFNPAAMFGGDPQRALIEMNKMMMMSPSLAYNWALATAAIQSHSWLTLPTRAIDVVGSGGAHKPMTGAGGMPFCMQQQMPEPSLLLQMIPPGTDLSQLAALTNGNPARAPLMPGAFGQYRPLNLTTTPKHNSRASQTSFNFENAPARAHRPPVGNGYERSPYKKPGIGEETPAAADWRNKMGHHAAARRKLYARDKHNDDDESGYHNKNNNRDRDNQRNSRSSNKNGDRGTEQQASGGTEAAAQPRHTRVVRATQPSTNADELVASSPGPDGDLNRGQQQWAQQTAQHILQHVIKDGVYTQLDTHAKLTPAGVASGGSNKVNKLPAIAGRGSSSQVSVRIEYTREFILKCSRSPYAILPPCWLPKVCATAFELMPCLPQKFDSRAYAAKLASLPFANRPIDSDGLFVPPPQAAAAKAAASEK